jgi:diadenosine tetraphosphatase ApaH/serine/threonine PP2A family protein phosphatase
MASGTVVLMSDIHGNFTALETVARSLPRVDAVYVAGDLCFEGPEPERVVDALREWGWTAVMGNTDADLSTDDDPKRRAKRSARLDWTREMLGPERLAWLASLPFSVRHDSGPAARILVVHANPRDMNTHLDPDMCADDLAPFLDGVEEEIIAFGHLHIPYLRPVGRHVLADVSSVGHPKDGDRRAAYTLVRFDGERRSIEQVRVPYDIEETVRLLRESGMPAADDAAEDLLRASY